MHARSTALDSKPAAALCYSTSPAQPGPLAATLVVFLNGLLLPRAAWSRAIDRLLAARTRAQLPVPALLSYDRYGQGDSDPDATDDPGSDYGHDARAVVADLHQLLTHVCGADLNMSLHRTRLLFGCNSIGCPLARLYAAAHPGRVAGFLFLDSMMANTDFVSLFPDPDADGFDPSRLPSGVSAEDIRSTREKYRAMFHPSTPNPERFDRRNLAQLLPRADEPKLPNAPLLTVVGHDWDEFAEQGFTGSLGVPKAVTNAYVNPAWHAYNEGLCRLSGAEEGVKGPIIASGCGHFIQRDDPDFVAAELGGLLDRLDSQTVARENGR